MTVNRPIDLEVFQDAVHSWFSGSTGLFTVWRRQNAPQPSYPFAALQITTGPTPLAPQWEQRFSTNLSRPLGQEVQTIVCVPCSMVVSCQAYVDTSDARDPNYSAVMYIARAQSALSLPSYLAALRADNISVISPGVVQNIDELIEDAFVSRANLDVTFGTTLTLEEYTGFIEKVHATSTNLGIDQVFGVT